MVSGRVVSFNIVNAGAGYTSVPTVTITPRANAADGWSETPKISEDGNFSLLSLIPPTYPSLPVAPP